MTMRSLDIAEEVEQNHTRLGNDYTVLLYMGWKKKKTKQIVIYYRDFVLVISRVN